MAKLTLSTILSGFASTTSFNNALTSIVAEFQNKVLYRDNPTGEPNQMENNLDMNSFNILNVGTINGVSSSLLTDLSSYVAAANSSATNAALSETNAASSAASALVSETNAASSATQAAIYSSMGLGGAIAFDFGLVTDAVVIFPTDWGLIV